MINTIKGEKLNLYTNSNLYVNELFVIFCLSLSLKNNANNYLQQENKTTKS